MSKIFNTLCIVSIIAAAVMLYRGNARRVFAESEVNRLSKRFGELDVKNKDQFLVVGVSEEFPNCFAWRIYMPDLPTGLATRSKSLEGSSGNAGGMKEESCEYRVVFRHRIVDEKPTIFLSSKSGSSLSSLPKKLWPFLSQHWDELEFKVLGDGRPVSVSTNEVVCLLEIRVPENLLNEVPEPYRKKLESEPLYRYAHGTSAAFNSSNDNW